MPRLIAVVYTLGFLALAAYWAKVLLVTAAYLMVRRRTDAAPEMGDRPFVTVQLPVYNERYVAARVIDAACRLRWPSDLFEIQVLDDSTDETCGIVDDAARAWRGKGVDIQVVRRQERSGYKAGALAYGALLARGSVFAIFDADFIPSPDFLERTVPFLSDGVGAVQTRWGHLNGSASGLTRAQALALDGHFLVEQTTRSRCGLMLNFNGTAGLWRREAIRDAGGWQHDTLSEDVDLSYRAQLAGWRLRFLPEVVVPGEIPATLPAFKRQQRRWATGTTQVLVKLGGEVLRSDRSLRVRVHAIVSLASHLVHPVTLGMFLLAPLMLVYQPALHSMVGILTIVSLSPPLMLAVAARDLHSDWLRRLAAYPLLALLAVGMSLNGTVAVWHGLTRCGGAFERTPKAGGSEHSGSDHDGSDHGSSEHGGAEHGSSEHGSSVGYQLPADKWVLVEALLAAYAWLGLAAALWRGSAGLSLFLALFAIGYTLTAFLSAGGRLSRALSLRRTRSRRRTRAHARAGER
jgi:cellulose synthase/poly-beta-1,6-N-acetylglucosamine synthase-like glycosyltransferase